MHRLTWTYLGAPNQRHHMVRMDQRGPWSYPMHQHAGYGEFHLLLRGQEQMCVNGREVLLAPGDLMLLRPDDEHDVRGTDVLHFNLNIQEADLRRLVAYLGLPGLLTSPTPPSTRLSEDSLAHITKQAERLWAHQWTSDSAAVLLPILAEWGGLVAAPAAGTGDEPTWFAEAEAAVVADPTLGPGTLATVLGLSPAYLARAFRRWRGCTPSSWLVERRLDRAAHELAHGGQDILGVCFTCGFASVSHFYRAFRARHGLAPAAWRRRHAPINF